MRVGVVLGAVACLFSAGKSKIEWLILVYVDWSVRSHTERDRVADPRLCLIGLFFRTQSEIEWLIHVYV